MLQLSSLRWAMILGSLTVAAGFQLPTHSRLDVFVKDESGGRLNFTWRRFDGNGVVGGGPVNWTTAWRFCDQQAAQLPYTNDLRFFYKAILSEAEGEESTFYLANVMDTTTDQPNAVIGERMCIVIRGKLGAPLRYAETDGIKSCSYTVNTVVCRLHKDNTETAPKLANETCNVDPMWLEDISLQAKLYENEIRIKKSVFYSCLGSLCMIFALITGTCITIFCKFIKMKRSIMHKHDYKSNALFGGFMQSSSSNESANFQIANDVSDYKNVSTKARYDLFHDTPLQAFGSFRSVPIHSLNYQTEKNIPDEGKLMKIQSDYDSKNIRQKYFDGESTGFL